MNELPCSLRRKQGGSDRSFGLVFAALFAIFGTIPLLRGEPPRWWLLALAAALLGLATIMPALLAPLHVLWRRVGAVLHKIMTPVIMAVLYFAVLCPIALVARLAGRDALRLRREAQSQTYWIKREPPGPEGSSMKNQF